MDRPEAPGWYDDPDDETLLRYFDGILWTDHTTRRSTQVAAPEPAQTPPPTPTGSHGQTPYAAPPPGYAPGAPGAVWQSAPPRPALADGAVLAQWWQRLLAAILDSIIVSVVSNVIGFPWVMRASEPLATALEQMVAAGRTGASAPDLQAALDDFVAAMLPLTILSIVVGVLYHVVFLVRTGATPGKMALGTTVRRVDRPGPLTLVEAVKRQTVRVASDLLSLVPLLGVLGSMLFLVDAAWLLWDPRRQTLHDKVADTVVVAKQR